MTANGRAQTRIRKIAEAFAEIERRRVDREAVGADVLRAAAAPFDVEADRHDELVLVILEHAVLERGLDVLESAGAGHDRPARRHRDASRSGANETAKSSVIRLENSPDISSCFTDGSSPVLETGDGRQRQFVVDAGIVDGERRRKEAVADDLVGSGRSQASERDRPGAQRRAQQMRGHGSLRFRQDIKG